MSLTLNWLRVCTINGGWVLCSLSTTEIIFKYLRQGHRHIFVWVLTWLCYHHNVGLVKWVWKNSHPSFSFLLWKKTQMAGRIPILPFLFSFGEYWELFPLENTEMTAISSSSVWWSSSGKASGPGFTTWDVSHYWFMLLSHYHYFQFSVSSWFSS